MNKFLVSSRETELSHSLIKLKFLLPLSCLLFHIYQLISQSDDLLCLLSQLLVESVHLGSQVLHGLQNVVDLVVLF